MYISPNPAAVFNDNKPLTGCRVHAAGQPRYNNLIDTHGGLSRTAALIFSVNIRSPVAISVLSDSISFKLNGLPGYNVIKVN